MLAGVSSRAQEILPGDRIEPGIDAVVTRSGGEIHVSLRLEGVPDDTVLQPLQSGLESELEFTVRHYSEERGITGILGDRLLTEVRRRYIVEWDPFDEQYVVYRSEPQGSTAVQGPGERFDSGDRMLGTFFKATGIVLPAVTSDGSDYLLVRGRLQPVRFVPALGILAILLPNDTLATSWRRVDLPEVVTN